MPVKTKKQTNLSSTDIQVLGKIFMLQSALHTISTPENMVEYLCRGLEIVPGTCFVAVRIDNHVKSTCQEFSLSIFEKNFCDFCYKESDLKIASGFISPGKHHGKFFCIRIQTINEMYGCIIFEKVNDSVFERYRPFLENLSNTIALNLEIRKQEGSQKKLQEELLHAKEGLELLVQERTRELVAKNEEIERSNKALTASQRASLNLMEDLQSEIEVRTASEEETKKTNEELLTINRVIYTCAGVMNIKEILDKVLSEVLRIVGLEGGTICLIEPDDTLKLISYQQTSEETISDLATNKIKVGDCLCGNCAHDNCPLILYNREDVLKYATREALRGEDIRFHAAFPVTSKEKCVAVLCVFTRTDKKPDTRSLKLLETLTTQVALAIENAMLVEGLEQRVFERTSQLKEANKELESFSYSISHDLRAPLRAIYGFSQILSSRHRASLNDEGKQYMDYVVDASIRMEQLINDLLNYSRLGRTSLNIQPVSLKAILDTISLDFRPELNETGGEIEIVNELPTIRADETLLRQIFSNLIGNAIKYRRNDVPLKIMIDFETMTDGYLIKIADNGIGIPEEHWEKIFNVFQRLHGEDKYPGTGIGLATVRKAMNILGGSVKVESIVGKGSIFLLIGIGG